MNACLSIFLILAIADWISLVGLFLTMIAGFAIIFYRLGIIMERFTALELRVARLEEFVYTRIPIIEARIDRLELRVERLAADCEPIIRAFPVLVQKVSELSIRVNELSKRMDVLTQRINEIVPKVDVMWSWYLATHRSPVALNDEGHRLLLYLGPNFVDASLYKEIVSAMKLLNPENRYQVQQQLTKLMANLANREEYRQFLENTAFEAGCSVDMLLYVAAINIRDQVLSDLNFNVKLLPHGT